jgi:tetratricopeptide (TPR) repeat protein
MGRNVGRYLVLESLGEGAMGAVYAAYDPELDRRVALKLLKAIPGTDAARLRNRLVREAQAMARLSHPNVVSVHDVGTFDEQVFVAMELVEGTTLAGWLRQSKPRWRDVLSVFLRAGEGLAAAHGAGLVHRDFKPANVLLGRNGEVKVSDFGLAVVLSEIVPGPSPPASRSRQTPPGAEHSTSTLFVGTPAYMSPEQLAGRPFDARSDQYSFCVALYEGLFGVRPGSEPVQDPTHAKAVPGWVTRPLLRGLSENHDERYPSMRALLEALAADPQRRRTRRLTMGGLVGLLMVSLVAGRAWWQRRAELCRGAEGRLAGVWDAPKREAITRAFIGSGVPYAGEVLSDLLATLDRRARGWSSMRMDACEATRIRGEQSESLLDVRMGCLQQRLDELRALTDVLVRVTPKVIEKAGQAADALPPIADCANTLALTSPTAPPSDPEKKAAAEELTRTLAQVQALTDTGQLAAALKAAEPLVQRAMDLGHKPLEAEVRFQLGQIQHGSGDERGAEQTLYGAIVASEQGHHDALRAQAWTSLVEVVGKGQARFQEGHRLAAQARAVLERLGSVPRLESRFRRVLGMLLLREGRVAEATSELERGLEGARVAYGDDHTEVAAARQNLGSAFNSAGRYAEAVTQYQEALQTSEKKLGPKHPLVATILHTLATVYRRQGKFDLAWDAALRSLAAREATFGPNSLAVGHSLNGLGLILQEQARYRDAEPYLRRSLALVEANLGPEHPDVAALDNNLANVVMNWDSAAAQALRTKALAIQQRAFGSDHLEIANTLSNLGWTDYTLGHFGESLSRVQRALAIRAKQPGPGTVELANDDDLEGDIFDATGRPTEGLACHRRALAVREAVLGSANPTRALSLTRMARSYLASEQPHRALPLAEEAEEVVRSGSVDPSEVALTHFTLARALFETRTDRTRALILAERARAEFAAIHIVENRYVRELDFWLARNRRMQPPGTAHAVPSTVR